MDIKTVLASYNMEADTLSIEKNVKKITGNISSIYTVGTLKKIFGLIDLTSLNNTDTPQKAKQLTERVNNFQDRFPDMQNVAAICMYPPLTEHIKNNLKVKGVKIVSVTGGFPSGQTFIDIKVEETKKVIEKGADEVDMIISAGTVLSGDFQTVYEEIRAIKNVCGNKLLKVILESGSLGNLTNVRIASLIALEAGADFLKTSSGKTKPAATLEAVYVMAQSVMDYFNKTGKLAGIKPAGGISDSETALKYFLLIKEFFEDDKITPEHVRIGSDNLANKLLNDISKMSSEQKEIINYF
jgi:deoxyribose-phosphate aldolase